MDAITLWRRYQSRLCRCPSVGLKLDTSRIEYPPDFDAKMQGATASALEAMDRLEAGAIANPDENRMVGHYWLRAPRLAPSPEIANQIQTTIADIKRFASDVHAGRVKPPTAAKFTDVLLIGIGGSALGPQLVSDALGSHRDRMRLHFLDNTDPDGSARTARALRNRLKSTLVLVVSKSGGTRETRNGMVEFEAIYRDRKLNFAQHAVAVTSAGSKLDEYARTSGWLARFPMWDWVGGRTSVTSAVGLLPMALQGLDIDRFLAGAAAMDELTRSHDVAANPAAQLALAWHAATDGRGLKDMVVLPYRDRLILLSRYLQQLIMESLGKDKDLSGRTVHQGITVYGNKGSTDQHAYVQQLRDGIANFFVTFVVVLEDPKKPREVEPGVTSGDYLSGFWQGTRSALFENGRQSLTLTLDRLDAHSLGAVIALYERAVGLYAGLVNINAYHQPGVEAGKKAAAAVLDLQKRVVSHLASTPGLHSAEEVAGAIGAAEQVETVYHVLEHLAANKRGVARRGDKFRHA